MNSNPLTIMRFTNQLMESTEIKMYKTMNLLEMLAIQHAQCAGAFFFSNNNIKVRATLRRRLKDDMRSKRQNKGRSTRG